MAIVRISKALTPRKTGKPLAAHAAQQRVQEALKTGRLKRPMRCSNCGRIGKVEFAHSSYGPGIHGRWLCPSCHRKLDKRNPKGGRMRGFSGRE